MIQLKNVSKTFHDQDHSVVHPLSLEIKDGEFLTILGPSGCGKTTILRMIAGFEQPTEGEIYIHNKSINSLPPYKRDVNLVFQQYALFPRMTVQDNILFSLKMKKIPMAEQRIRLSEAVALTQLEGLLARYPHQLSGGQQQRVAIARAIIGRPKVLLLDEPLGALDLKLRKSLQTELKTLQRNLGITFIYVTHDQEEAMFMSDRIVIMNQGRVEQIGSPREIYTHPQSLFAATFIGENNIFRDNDKMYAVRPEKIRLGDPSQAYRKIGKIQDIIYLGSTTKVAIQLENEDTTVMAVWHHQHSSAEPIEASQHPVPTGLSTDQNGDGTVLTRTQKPDPQPAWMPQIDHSVGLNWQSQDEVTLLR